MSSSITLLGIRVTLMRDDELEDRLRAFLSRPHQHHIITLNPEMLVRANRESEYRALLKRADLATADGFGIILAARLTGQHAHARHRVTGVRLTEKLLAMAAARSLSTLIVVPPNSLTPADRMQSALHKKYPQLDVRVITAGAVPHDTLRADRPAIVFVTLGAPQQERWIADNRTAFENARIMVGVGGTFDFISGTLKRAPRWMRTIGIEWLWRLLLEPKRFLRIVRAVFIFPLIIVRKR